MYCLRCGREIPDGELFCHTCAKQPIEKQQPPESHAPVRVAETRQVETVEPRREAPASVKRKNRLVIPFILVCLLLVMACAFTVYSYQTLNVQKANYRVKEANLALRETELSGLQENYDTVSAELETAQATISDRDETIRSLQQEIVTLESAASQSEYDVTSAQKRIDDLTEENETLTEENETLSTEKETLETEKTELEAQLEEKIAAAAAIQAELDTMTGRYNTVKAKADFMDSYVVFVNNNGTNYYHTYDCANFTKSNFWAYSRKLAQNNGYTACPVCGG